MKSLLLTLCLCLALTAVPCASLGADHPRAERAGGILSSALVGAGAGLLVGTFIALLSQSTSGTAMGAGLVAGAFLGALYAIVNPAVEEPPPEPSGAAS